MNCKEYQLLIDNLLAENADKESDDKVMEHLQSCQTCTEYYQENFEVFSVLKLKVQLKAPTDLKQNVINQLKKEKKEMKNDVSKTVKLSSRSKKILSIAAVVCIILLIIPFAGRKASMDSAAKAANVFLQTSIKATKLIKSMIMKLSVRTIAKDNFALVGTEYEMVEHTIQKTFAQPERWRIDKGERIVVNNGEKQFLWIPQSESAYTAGKNANFAEWFKLLLEPEKILEKEQNMAKTDGSVVKMNENNKEIQLSITSKAKGNFINDYCKNQSIIESDNRREYIFDKGTKLLKSLKIFIIEKQKETLILETKSIEYDVDIPDSTFIINLPEGITWKELNYTPNSNIFKNISSKRAAELFFESLAKEDWKTVAQTCDFFTGNSEKINALKDEFGGLKVIKIGESFKSGLYSGEFVPYEIQLKSGETLKMNLALRNDNKNKIWLVDGGF